MRRLLLFAAFPLLLLAASCVDQTTVEPALAPQYSEVPTKFDKLAVYETPVVKLSSALTWKIIGPQGGSLALHGFQMIVPPGAVSRATLFTIHLPVDANGSQFVRAQFGPHRQFNAPITIRLPLKGTNAEDTDARVLWWNGFDWEPFPTVPTSDGRIETTTWHFSEYGTEAPPEKGIILIGG
jgi:hypothetical protein